MSEDAPGNECTRALPGLQPRGGKEVGTSAVWSASSAKSGNGVSCVRDGRPETYWQSDGSQPHTINAQFARRVALQSVSIYVDCLRDESYTPSTVSIRAGNTSTDLREVARVSLEEPQGWTTIHLCDDPDACVRAFVLQIAVLSNHQNGRDTHVRMLHVYGPSRGMGKGKGGDRNEETSSLRDSFRITLR